LEGLVARSGAEEDDELWAEAETTVAAP